MRKIFKFWVLSFLFVMLILPFGNVNASTMKDGVEFLEQDVVVPEMYNYYEKTSLENVIFANEYEIYNYYISLSDEELLEIGYSKDDIEYLRNFDYKEALLERAQMSDEQLSVLGYSEEEATLVQSYDGSDDIETYALAKISISSSLSTASSQRFKIYFWWSWSSCPVWLGTDMIAVVWAGTNSSGSPMNVAVSKSQYDTYQNVTYYDTYTKKSITEKKTFSFNNEYGAASSSFSMGYNYGDGYMRWATKGSGYVTVSAVAGSLYELLMRFEYGHTYMSGSPSFSVSGTSLSPSISFNRVTQSVGATSHRYRSNGTTVS